MFPHVRGKHEAVADAFASGGAEVNHRKPP